MEKHGKKIIFTNHYIKTLICDLNYKKSITLFEEINKNLSIKELKRAKIKAALKIKYENEMVIKLIAYKYSLFLLFFSK